MTSDPRGRPQAAAEPTSHAPGGAAQPVVIFAILLLVVAVVAGAALLLVGSEPAQQPATAASPLASPTQYSLTDEQAIERFKELETLSFEALEERDAQVVASVYSPDSPLRKGVLQDLTELKRSNTVVSIGSKSLSITVERITPTEIRLRQMTVIRTRFTRVGSGEKAGGTAERQTIKWSLRREGANWFIHDALVVAAEQI